MRWDEVPHANEWQWGMEKSVRYMQRIVQYPFALHGTNEITWLWAISSVMSPVLLLLATPLFLTSDSPLIRIRSSVLGMVQVYIKTQLLNIAGLKTSKEGRNGINILEKAYEFSSYLQVENIHPWKYLPQVQYDRHILFSSPTNRSDWLRAVST